MLNTAAQSDGSSADQRVEKSSEADSEVGSPLGPDMPALFTKERGFDERERERGRERRGTLHTEQVDVFFFL